MIYNNHNRTIILSCLLTTYNLCLVVPGDKADESLDRLFFKSWEDPVNSPLLSFLFKVFYCDYYLGLRGFKRLPMQRSVVGHVCGSSMFRSSGVGGASDSSVYGGGVRGAG